MRDLNRTRGAALHELRAKRHQVSALLLRLGRSYPGRKTWGQAHTAWLAGCKLAHSEQRLALEEMPQAVRQANERIARLAQAMRAAVPDWSLAPLATALMALRGIDFVAATTLVAEIGDPQRFAQPRELMAWLGLVPSEHSTGEHIKRGPITKTGNRRARSLLIECAWSYRHPARVGSNKLAKLEAVLEEVQEIAWKAQIRLTARYRTLRRAGKLDVVAITAGGTRAGRLRLGGRAGDRRWRDTSAVGQLLASAKLARTNIVQGWGARLTAGELPRDC